MSRNKLGQHLLHYLARHQCRYAVPAVSAREHVSLLLLIKGGYPSRRLFPGLLSEAPGGSFWIFPATTFRAIESVRS